MFIHLSTETPAVERFMTDVTASPHSDWLSPATFLSVFNPVFFKWSKSQVIAICKCSKKPDCCRIALMNMRDDAYIKTVHTKLWCPYATTRCMRQEAQALHATWHFCFRKKLI